MKYRLLSKEQFESLSDEFAKFLAAQQIDKKDWDVLKAANTEEVQRQLEGFSDLVWDEVLRKTTYLEHYSKKSLNVFYCMEETISRLVVRVEKEGIDLQTKAGFDWFLDHSKDASIHYFKGEKKYQPSRNKELFQLIEKGAILSDDKLYAALSELINKT